MDGSCASFPRSLGWTYPSNFLLALFFVCAVHVAENSSYGNFALRSYTFV